MKKELENVLKSSESLAHNVFTHFALFNEQMTNAMLEIVKASGKDCINIDMDIVTKSEDIDEIELSMTQDNECAYVKKVEYKYNNVYLTTEYGDMFAYSDISISDKVNFLYGFIKYLKLINESL